MDLLGSLIITGFRGLALNDEDKKFLKDEKIGGVILFADNYENPSQLAELVNSIQALRDELPLFISVDHEGGRVQRFKKHFTHFPAMFELAKLNSPKYIFEVHQVMAKELSACGINLDFSPVCDIWTNPQNAVIGDRAFGTTVEDVEKFISAAIRGLQSYNVMTCAKHFPGHGNTLKDSHYDLPLIRDSLEDIRKRELLPFIKASRSRAEFMMMAHLLIEELDPDLPTTVSKKAYEFLRKETKFTKIVITDDMIMKAITDRFSIGEGGVLALEAGADVILHRNSSDARLALEAIKKSVKDRRLNREIILDKIRRINELKKEKMPPYKPIYIPQITESFQTPEAKSLLNQYKNWQSQNSQAL